MDGESMIGAEWIEFYRRHRPSLTELRALVEWAEAGATECPGVCQLTGELCPPECSPIHQPCASVRGAAKEAPPTFGGHTAEEVAELCDMLAVSADRMTNSYSETAAIARRARDAIRFLLGAEAEVNADSTTLLPSQIAQRESNKKWLRNHPPNLGRIGQLAEELRCAARSVTNDMYRTPGGDAFEYRGSTSAVDDLIDKLNALEHFQAGWVP